MTPMTVNKETTKPSKRIRLSSPCEVNEQAKIQTRITQRILALLGLQESNGLSDFTQRAM